MGVISFGGSREAETIRVMVKKVVVVGCFAASTACFLLKFGQNIPGPT